MQKSFLQQIGESMPGFIYGLDIYDMLNRQQSSEAEMDSESREPNHEMKALKEINKRH